MFEHRLMVPLPETASFISEKYDQHDCVRQTIEKVLPEEIRYLENYDRMKMAKADLVDMPDYQNSLMIQFLEQNRGKFSKRSRTKEFNFRSDEECTRIEELYADIFSAP